MEETLPQPQTSVNQVLPDLVPPVQPPPPKTLPLKWILIIALLAGIVLAGIFLIFKSQSGKQSPQLTPQSSIQPVISSTPTPDETANWKTYTNNKLGFSVKYPSQTKIIEGGKYSVDGVFVKNPNLTSFNVNITDQESKESGFGNMQLSISVEENKNSKTLDSLRQEFSGQNPDEDIQGNKIQSFLLDGKPAIRGVAGGTRGAYIILSIYKNRIYRLVFEPDINKTGDQIPSTFKFRELSSSPEQIGDAASKDECFKKSGVWQKWGMLQKEFCQIPAVYAGKLCTDGTQCSLGHCKSESNILPGKCQTYNAEFGCYSFVEQGKITQGICTD